MTLDEAIKVINNRYEIMNYCENARLEKALEIAIESLEKQIPKKPVKSKKPRYGMGYDYYDWECPTCGSFLAFESDLGRLKKIHHCKCGQAINKEN